VAQFHARPSSPGSPLGPNRPSRPTARALPFSPLRSLTPRPHGSALTLPPSSLTHRAHVSALPSPSSSRRSQAGLPLKATRRAYPSLGGICCRLSRLGHPIKLLHHPAGPLSHSSRLTRALAAVWTQTGSHWVPKSSRHLARPLYSFSARTKGTGELATLFSFPRCSSFAQRSPKVWKRWTPAKLGRRPWRPPWGLADGWPKPAPIPLTRPNCYRRSGLEDTPSG